MNKEQINKLSRIILDCSIEVHRNLGPGLLESVYKLCLCKELSLKGIRFKRQVLLPVNYKGQKLEAEYKIDTLVKDEIIVELKSVEEMHPVY